MKNTYPVIGMSPGNSYFKDEVIKKLLRNVVENYGKTVILIADVPAISTYIALGYPENRARRDKAIPQGNNLKNSIRRAMTELNYSTKKVRIIDWKNEIQNNVNYKEAYNKLIELYETNILFQESANEATRGVLEYSGKEISDINEAIKIAVHYLLAELAFMEFAPEFLQTEKVIYIYHKEWPVYEQYISGKFDGVVRSNLGFILTKEN